MKAHYAKNLPDEWQKIARMFDGLGDVSRQTIMLLFDQNEELTIKQMCQVLSLSRTSIVHHVATLERAELLLRRKAGRDVFFRINKNILISTLERVIHYVKTEV